MDKKAIALHVIEKGKKVINIRCIDKTREIWETGNWAISDDTANSLKDGTIYVHEGQLVPSHIGGNILSFRNAENDGNRKIFIFKALAAAKGITSTKDGWSNEKKLVWQQNFKPELQIPDEDEESSFPEGSVKYLLHKARERDPALARKAKLARIKKNRKA